MLALECYNESSTVKDRGSMMIEYADIVKAELIENNISLCVGCDSRQSHNRGFAAVKERVIHYSRKCATRSTLHGFLHEVGHIVKGHEKGCGLKRWEREQEAERYATESLRTYGISVPRKSVQLGKKYVARWKSFGKKISYALS